MLKAIRIVTIVLLLGLAYNAITGGISLVSDPSGATMEFPLDLLEGTPFTSYLIPGIILLLANGLLALIAIVGIVRTSRNYFRLIILQGCVLIGWLSSEIILNADFYYPPLHLPFYALGVIIIVLGLWIRNLERRNVNG